MPCKVSWRLEIRILHLSSLATLLCFIREIAVTRVSIAEANSPLAASWTALAMAELETVRFLLMISSNSGSDRPWGTSWKGTATGAPGGKKAGLT